MTTIAQTAAERLLAELAERYGGQPFDPAQDFTLKQFMTALRLAEHPARRILDAEVDAGRIAARRVRGLRETVYRRA